MGEEGRSEAWGGEGVKHGGGQRGGGSEAWRGRDMERGRIVPIEPGNRIESERPEYSGITQKNSPSRRDTASSCASITTSSR